MRQPPKIPDDNHLSVEFGRIKAFAKGRFAIGALIVLFAINCIVQVAIYLLNGG